MDADLCFIAMFDMFLAYRRKQRREQEQHFARRMLLVRQDQVARVVYARRVRYIRMHMEDIARQSLAKKNNGKHVILLRL